MEANSINVDINEVDSLNESFQSTLEGPEPSLDMLEHLPELYKNELAMIRNNGEGDKLKMENRLLHSWVKDLVQQNNLLVIPVQTLETKALDRIRNEQRDRLEQRQHSESTTVESQLRRLHDSNVQLLEEVETLRRMCCTLEEQCRAQSSRAQFKDDIIMEMRRQLKQAKAMVTQLKEAAAELHSTCNVRPHTDRPDTKLAQISKLDGGDASRTTCNIA